MPLRYPIAGMGGPIICSCVAGQDAMQDLESIVHPLVVEARDRFLLSLPPGQPLVLFDIPLLYETGGRETVRSTWKLQLWCMSLGTVLHPQAPYEIMA